VSSLVLQSRSPARSAQSFWRNYGTFVAVPELLSICLIFLLVNRHVGCSLHYVIKLCEIRSISLLLRGVAVHCFCFLRLILSYRSSWNQVFLSAAVQRGLNVKSLSAFLLGESFGARLNPG